MFTVGEEFLLQRLGLFFLLWLCTKSRVISIVKQDILYNTHSYSCAVLYFGAFVEWDVDMVTGPNGLLMLDGLGALFTPLGRQLYCFEGLVTHINEEIQRTGWSTPTPFLFWYTILTSEVWVLTDHLMLTVHYVVKSDFIAILTAPVFKNVQAKMWSEPSNIIFISLYFI